jgi:hypothetical protein
VKHNVGAATLLIHILAKQDTPIKESSTVLGRVPAKLKTRVISTRSMLVLLNADAMVNPPISSMMVGENMTENIYLTKSVSIQRQGVMQTLLCCMTCRETGIIFIWRAYDAEYSQ